MPVETNPLFSDIPLAKQKRLSTNELYIGNYVLRNWCKEIEVIQAYCAITISSIGMNQVEIWGFPAYLGAETGTDLTGRGYPDIVIISAQGNPSDEIIVYEAGKSLKKIMDIRSRNSVRFVDLNNDKSYEALADARIWSQFSGCSPIIIPLVYEYNAESGYTDKTSKYREILLPDIQLGVDSLASYKLENPNTEVPLCRVYHLVTAYLVSGEKEKAWSILDENYSPEKAAEYKAGFQEDLGSLIP
jgi:hypothetical protein